MTEIQEMQRDIEVLLAIADKHMEAFKKLKEDFETLERYYWEHMQTHHES